METDIPARDNSNLQELLSFLLPNREDTLLLRACLHTGHEGREAWKNWQAEVGDPKALFEQDTRGLKGLLPLVEFALRRNEVSAEKSLLTYLRTARVREELRNDIYRSILKQTLTALSVVNIAVIVLRGSALADTVYEEAGSRHNHGIDFLVEEAHMQHATKVLLELGLKTAMQQPGVTLHHLRFEHETGLPVELHCKLFYLPHYDAPLREVWERSVPQILSGIQTRTLSPPDYLLYVCGHASYSSNRSNLRWVCDSWYLAHRCQDRDWDILLSYAQKNGLILPFYAVLNYLAEHLEAPISAHTLNQLSRIVTQGNGAGYESIIISALANIPSLTRLLKQFGKSWQMRIALVKFALLPSSAYIRWRHHVLYPWLLPYYYLYRPTRFVLRRMYQHLRLC